MTNRVFNTKVKNYQKTPPNSERNFDKVYDRYLVLHSKKQDDLT